MQRKTFVSTVMQLMALRTFSAARYRAVLLRHCRSNNYVVTGSLTVSRGGALPAPRSISHTSTSTSALHQGHNMREWAEWEAVMQTSNGDDHNELGLTDIDALVTPTPHPAAASTAERCEWEAVLTAAEDSAAPKSALRTSVAQQLLHAVIECGSHSTRLLLSTGTADVERLTFDTYLGNTSKHMEDTNTSQPHQQQQQKISSAGQPSHLQEDASAATLDALRHYRTILDKYTLAGTAAVATAAVREAANADELVAVASSILGCQLQVLSGHDEGRFAFMGATASLAATAAYCLVFDMGGRSTEFSVGTAGQAPLHVCSIPLGCLNLQPGAASIQASALGQPQQHQGQQLVQTAQQVLADHADLLQGVQQAYHAAQQQLQEGAGVHCRCPSSTCASLKPSDGVGTAAAMQGQPVEVSSATQQHQIQRQPQPTATEAGRAARADQQQPVVIGTGGTITTVAALLQRLSEYSHDAVHMSTLKQEDVQWLMGQLQYKDECSRLTQNYLWLTEARASSLLPGCAGILAIMQYLDVQQVLVSDCDLLDGVVQSMVMQSLNTPL